MAIVANIEGSGTKNVGPKGWKGVPFSCGHKIPDDGPKDGHIDEIGDLSNEGRVFRGSLTFSIDAKHGRVGHNFESDSVGCTDDNQSDKHEEQLERETFSKLHIATRNPEEELVFSNVKRLDGLGRFGAVLGVVNGAIRS